MSEAPGWILALLVLLWPQAQPALDRTVTAPLTGGGEVTIRADGEYLDVNVTGPRAGLASLCAGDRTRVRILHASAAVGEAVYERDGERWRLISGFDWKLRDSPTSGGPGDAERRAFLDGTGWVANASRTGAPERVFRIRRTDGIRFIGVTFLSTSAPIALSHWPPTMADGCRDVEIAQGLLPETLTLRPTTWHPVR